MHLRQNSDFREVAVDTGLDFIRSNVIIVGDINSLMQRSIPLSILIIGISLIAAMLVGGVVGYLSTYPAIRLRQDYLSITLLSLGEVQRIIAMSYTPIAGGSMGILIPDPFAAFGDIRFVAFTGFALLILLLVFVYLRSVTNAPLGRTLRAIRDNELAAEVVGKDTLGFRRKVMIIGSALGALGGALYSFYTISVSADTFSRTQWTVIPWLVMIIGGMGNVKGSLAGTFIIVLGQRLLDIGRSYLGFLPFNPVWLQYPLFGIFIIGVVLLRPQGIIPEKPSIRVKKQQKAS
jgi:branched-chain amino acid transport system permease protein